MLQVMLGFLRGIGTLAKPWWVWIGLLAVVNGVVPLAFLGTVEGRAVLAAIVVGAVVQMALFRRFGFVRLLGLGHIVVWVPLLPWLAGRLAAIGIGSGFGKWLLAVLVLDAVSLVIDFVDVARWLRGERTPALTLGDLAEG